jgi:hypothetical protein
VSRRSDPNRRQAAHTVVRCLRLWTAILTIRARVDQRLSPLAQAAPQASTISSPGLYPPFRTQPRHFGRDPGCQRRRPVAGCGAPPGHTRNAGVIGRHTHGAHLFETLPPRFRRATLLALMICLSGPRQSRRPSAVTHTSSPCDGASPFGAGQAARCASASASSRPAGWSPSDCHRPPAFRCPLSRGPPTRECAVPAALPSPSCIQRSARSCESVLPSALICRPNSLRLPARRAACAAA